MTWTLRIGLLFVLCLLAGLVVLLQETPPDRKQSVLEVLGWIVALAVLDRLITHFLPKLRYKFWSICYGAGTCWVLYLMAQPTSEKGLFNITGQVVLCVLFLWCSYDNWRKVSS
jgi:hypothetical protein